MILKPNSALAFICFKSRSWTHNEIGKRVWYKQLLHIRVKWRYGQCRIQLTLFQLLIQIKLSRTQTRHPSGSRDKTAIAWMLLLLNSIIAWKSGRDWLSLCWNSRIVLLVWRALDQGLKLRVFKADSPVPLRWSLSPSSLVSIDSQVKTLHHRRHLWTLPFRRL